MTHKLQNQPYSTLKDSKPTYKQLEQEVAELRGELKRRYEMHDFQNKESLKDKTEIIELKKENAAQKKQLTELAEALESIMASEDGARDMYGIAESALKGIES